MAAATKDGGFLLLVRFAHNDNDLGLQGKVK
jgi:hypothetical protein